MGKGRQTRRAPGDSQGDVVAVAHKHVRGIVCAARHGQHRKGLPEQGMARIGHLDAVNASVIRVPE